MEKQEIVEWMYSNGWILTSKAVERDDYLSMRLFVMNATKDDEEKKIGAAVKNYIRRQKLKQYE